MILVRQLSSATGKFIGHCGGYRNKSAAVELLALRKQTVSAVYAFNRSLRPHRLQFFTFNTPVLIQFLCEAINPKLDDLQIFLLTFRIYTKMQLLPHVHRLLEILEAAGKVRRWM